MSGSASFHSVKIRRLGLRGVAHKCICPSQLKVCQRPDWLMLGRAQSQVNEESKNCMNFLPVLANAARRDIPIWHAAKFCPTATGQEPRSVVNEHAHES